MFSYTTNFSPLLDVVVFVFSPDYLLSSPPGEIKEVLSDVKVVLDPPSLLTDNVLKVRRVFCSLFPTIPALPSRSEQLTNPIAHA